MKKSWKLLLSILVIFAITFACTQSMIKTEQKETYDEEKDVYNGFVYFNGENIAISYEKIDGLNVFQGDMVFPESMISDNPLQIRVSRAVGQNTNLWPDNTLYYQINPNVFNESAIRQAVANINNQTTVTLVEGTGTGNYVNIIPNYSGESRSNVGMVGGAQNLELADWADTGTAMHELLHALGFWHEHSRPSRDNYVIIKWDNIKPDKKHNFAPVSGAHIIEVGGNTFDFNSIMLYPPYNNFAIDTSKPTITKLDGSTYTANRTYLSSDDIAGVNLLYPGDNSSPYASIQCRVQRNIEDPWDTHKTISLGQSIRIGTMFDGTGYFAEDQYITQTVTGPGMNMNPVIGEYITPGQAGTYDVVSVTKDGSLTNSASFTVTGGSTSPYSSIQCRVQRNIEDPWDTYKTITLGQSIRIGTMYDGTGYFAEDQYITQTVTGPGMNMNPVIGEYITPGQAGTYNVVSVTKDGSLTNSASFTVTGGSTSPYSSIQCRVQKDIENPWNTNRNIYKGDSIRIGTMYDGTGYFAEDQYITQTVTGPNGYNSTPKIGEYIFPTSLGQYQVTSTTMDGSLVDQATFTVKIDSNCPYTSIQCRVQRNIEDPWDTHKTISLGQGIRIGSMYNAYGLFAEDTYVVQIVYGPDNWKVHPSIGDYITPLSKGTYQVISISKDGRFTDQSSFTVQ